MNAGETPRDGLESPTLGTAVEENGRGQLRPFMGAIEEPDAPVRTEDLAERRPFSAPLAEPGDDDATPPPGVTAPRPALPALRTDAGHAGAAEFTDSRMLRLEPTLAQRGWRRWLYLGTGGLLKLGRSAGEEREAERMAKVSTPIVGSRRVVVLSRKGGVGKTTTTLMLGHTFATHRGDRVVALDGNPDAGSLGYRVRRETTATVTTLLADRERIERYASIRGYTSQAPTRLEVVAADDDPSVSTALGYDDYQEAIRLLDRHYNLILLDTGTGILDSATQGILDMADQIVVVLAPSLDSARAASLTLDWLDAHGYGALVSDAVAVVNQMRGRSALRRQAVEEHFERRCRSVARIPWDPRLEAGAQVSLRQLRPQTRSAYLDLAAEIADGFASSTRHGPE